jgi:hypothetical protein
MYERPDGSCVKDAVSRVAEIIDAVRKENDPVVADKNESVPLCAFTFVAVNVVATSEDAERNANAPVVTEANANAPLCAVRREAVKLAETMTRPSDWTSRSAFPSMSVTLNNDPDIESLISKSQFSR